ncbi:MAG: NifB/NifX family molybdenum-iron cluster-binding protein [Halanaeroarchaeum sp.]
MRACLPTTDDAGVEADVSDHFGRAPYYTIVDTATGDVEVVENKSRHRGGEQMPPTFVAEQDVDVVVLDHVGKRGMNLFETHGIDVYEVQAGTVEAAIDAFDPDESRRLGMDDAHSHGDEHGHDRAHDH